MVKVELDEEDRKILEKCIFVVHDKRISFPQGATYSIERLEKIIKEAKKMKNKKGEIMCGLILEFPYKLNKKSRRKTKNRKATKKVMGK